MLIQPGKATVQRAYFLKQRTFLQISKHCDNQRFQTQTDSYLPQYAICRPSVEINLKLLVINNCCFHRELEFNHLCDNSRPDPKQTSQSLFWLLRMLISSLVVIQKLLELGSVLKQVSRGPLKDRAWPSVQLLASFSAPCSTVTF